MKKNSCWGGALSLIVAGCGVAPATSAAVPIPESEEPPTGGEHRTGPAPSLRLWLEPADLTTDASTTPLVARVQWAGTPPGAEVLAEVGSALSLTDSRGAELPASVRPPRGSLDEFAGYGEIELLPESPLEPGWYVLRADALGRYYDLSETQRVAPRGDGSSAAVRFHVGSSPLVQHVQICRRTDEQWTVVAELSERVRSDDALAMAQLLRRGGPSCSRDLLVDPMIPPADDAESVTTLRWGCTGLSDSEQLDLAIPSGIHGLSGTPMVSGTLSFSLAEGQAVGDRCALVRGVPGADILGYEAL